MIERVDRMRRWLTVLACMVLCVLLMGGALAEDGGQDAPMIIAATIEEGGAMNELTVFQMVLIPETGMLWLRVIGGAGWTQIDLSGFLR